MFDKIKRLLAHTLIYGLGNSGVRIVGFLLILVRGLLIGLTWIIVLLILPAHRLLLSLALAARVGACFALPAMLVGGAWSWRCPTDCGSSPAGTVFMCGFRAS
jgi:hypothetical protein